MAVSLDQLEIGVTLGQTRSSLVQKVVDKSSGQVYALKSIRKSAMRSESQIRRAMAEKYVTLSCPTQTIMKCFATYQDDDFIRFLFEYIDGESMYELLQSGRILNDAETSFVAKSLASTLIALHSKGVLYRDLKPPNVMVQRDGSIKLIDFGMCKLLNEEEVEKEQSLVDYTHQCGEEGEEEKRKMSTVGTPHYFAPELVQGKPYNSKIDWWMLGVLLYEMRSGVSPFDRGEMLSVLSRWMILKGAVLS
mmetsp:Transcript_47492/g.122979  ORF Transcript_47492/g.122979 Transcript_47492/m.122979 type:complete len:249 (-) Transcript_47492:332-1078(-)